MGNPRYKNRSIYISASEGDRRYKISKRYGIYRSRGFNLRKNDDRNQSFIILDYWVDKSKNREEYYIREEYFEILRKHNMNWFKDRDKEVLIKYAMFPHQIVGYYYFENDKLIHYKVNPFYVDKWREDPDFKIGDRIYISQDIHKISDKLPFDRIYTNCNGIYSVSEI